ncbi:TFIID-18kDa-domain-containing protein [Auriculariales sp. MPI-PUGE-AT-0066]|nr:TFIID-18kDa-domain-containing protein [Auriculariales sp. MPI-PUGE-AT-0066]
MSKPARQPVAQVERDYKYSQEISQMMFVFGEVQDPNPETVNLVEDIIRSQVTELIIQARQLASRKGARSVSAEDLIFFIRHDKGKVNRLRTYLSWKDVRKHAKDDAAGGGDVAEMEEGEDNTPKAQKITVKLPWEISTTYTEILQGLSDDEEDDDDVEAHEASVLRLKEADDATRLMTREEYEHYSDCRQASFTYRKAKRFRDFLNLPPHLDLKSGDDTVDIVGFLAFEMVRSLTLSGLSVKRSLEEQSVLDSPVQTGSKRKDPTFSPEQSNRASKRRRSSSPDAHANDPPVSSLFLSPPEARTALRPEHIYDAFARMQADWNHRRSSGMGNWRGGLKRTGVTLI